jgi:tetratricopeptide (TPR) repeat protein
MMKNMKKGKLLGLLTVGILSLFHSGCKKFLDINPLYTQDAENYFETAVDYERALTGAYDLLQGTFIDIWIGEIASDNSIAGGESVTDSEGLHEMDEMKHDAVNQELRNVFRWNYAGIARANYILEHKNKIDFDGKDKILAEATFLRAFYYSQLVKYFGDVPLIIDKRLGADEVTKTSRTPKSEVYARIEQDLQYAAGILDWTSSQKGRVNKGICLALLGKVYLYQNKFDQAAATFQQVIDDGNYSLISDVTKMFAVANEGHSETVFDVEYTGAEGGSYGCLICLEGNAAPGFHGIRQYDGPIYGDGNSYNLPTKDLYDAYEVGDVRRDATVLDLDAFIKKWDASDRKKAIIEELETEGLLLEALSNEFGGKLDPFDLILHVAFDQPVLTRKQRAEGARTSDIFEKYGPKAKSVLEALLVKYQDDGETDLTNARILTLPPVSHMGTPVEIVKWFGSRVEFEVALKELQHAIYEKVS